MRYLLAHLQGPKKRILNFISILVTLFALIFLSSNAAWAKPYRVLVISSGNTSTYNNIIDIIQSRVTSSKTVAKRVPDITFDIMSLNTTTTEQIKRSIREHDLLLTIGQRAMASVTKAKSLPPTIMTLIPKQSYDKHRSALHKINKQITAIFIDNPLERQVILAKILLGGTHSLGVLVGERAPYDKRTIKSVTQKFGLKSQIVSVKKTDNLIRKLSEVINDSDSFLALPDAQIFNRSTAKNILLTTYRQRTPIIAYSASYVRAGALAAVYSTPEQIADQTANTLIKFLTNGPAATNKDSHPSDFEISINSNVAKSLGIPVPSESQIKSELLKILGEKQ